MGPGVELSYSKYIKVDPLVASTRWERTRYVSELRSRGGLVGVN
jgi:hypothetical protein